MSHCWSWTTPRRARAALDRTSARRQLVLPVPCCLLANRAMKREIAGHRRRKDSLQRIGGTDLSVRRPAPSALLIPSVVRQKDHYVNRSVRGFRPPAGWRISPPRFDLPRLRMRRISHPQAVASPIQPTPGATHYVVTMPHRPFGPSARLLIPGCASQSAFCPRHFRRSHRLLFTVAGVVRPDLTHGDLPLSPVDPATSPPPPRRSAARSRRRRTRSGDAG